MLRLQEERQRQGVDKVDRLAAQQKQIAGLFLHTYTLCSPVLVVCYTLHVAPSWRNDLFFFVQKDLLAFIKNLGWLYSSVHFKS